MVGAGPAASDGEPAAEKRDFIRLRSRVGRVCVGVAENVAEYSK